MNLCTWTINTVVGLLIGFPLCVAVGYFGARLGERLYGRKP